MTWDDVHDGRTTFRACFDAMCRPGRCEPLPARPGITADPAVDAAAGVLLALLDPGVGLAVCGTAADAIGEALIRTSRADLRAAGDADFVLVLDGGEGTLPTTLRRGSAAAPERGATVVYAGGWRPSGVRIEGPGTGGDARARVGVPDGHLAAIEAVNRAAPPEGIDCLVVSPGGVVALPRSCRLTRIEA